MKLIASPQREITALPLPRLAGIPLTKTLLVVKLTLLLLTAALCASARTGHSQTITFSAKNASPQEVIQVVKEQAKLFFIYDEDVLSKAHTINVSARNMPVEEFLKMAFKDQPFTWTIQNQTVILEEHVLYVPRELPSPPPVTGIVRGADGKPLSGVNVMIKGTRKGVTTDASGIFRLEANVGDILVISYVGYADKEIKIQSLDKIIDTDMDISRSPLDDVQIIAYGTSSRRFSVSSVATVTSEQIERQPVANVLLALQGQVPGLIVTPTGAAPGSAVKIQIRGQNTLSTSPFRTGMYKPFDQPLFIVDGIPLAAQNTSLGNLLTLDIAAQSQTFVPGNGISPFNSLNPADVESITVLKDADATAIYGSQGANGVILITTKKGKPGKPSLNLSAKTGVTVATRTIDFLNTQQYLAMRREAFANDKIVPGNPTFQPDVLLFDSTRYTDWYSEFFTRNPGYTDMNATFSGGQQNSSFILSGGYTHTSYNFPGNFADNRLSLHSGYNYRSPNNKFTAQFGTDYSYNKNNASSQPSVVSAMRMAPNYPALLDENGDLIWRYKGVSVSEYQQYARLRWPAYIQVHSLNTNFRLAYQIIPGLTLSSTVSYSRASTNGHTERPLAAQEPGQYTTSSATFTSQIFETVNVEPQLDYKKDIGNGVLSVLAGGTYKKQNTNSTNLSGSDYPNDDLLGSVNGASIVSASNSSTLYKYVAGFARIGYIYNRRYILNLTGRRDGSSNFGPGRQFGNFGSVGAGWIFTEEGAVHRAVPFLSFGKLSGNYGTNGSDGIAPYMYQAYFEPASPNTYFPYQGRRAFTPSNVFNPDYSWGVKKSLNLSLDFGFIKDRILANLTWYQSRSSNQLISYPLPGQTGFLEVVGNFPAVVQNSGLEFSLNTTNIRNSKFSWTSSFNISRNRNKLVAFPGLEKSPYSNVYVVGKSTSVVQGYRYKGINDSTGIFEFFNGKGGVTSNPGYSHINNGGDVQPLFDVDPAFSGGMGQNLSYKGVSLSLFFQFSKQKMRNYLYGIYSFGVPGSYYNLPEVALDHWRKKGDQAPMQRLATCFSAPYFAGTAFANSTGAYVDAYYVRLKTLALSWSLPAQWLKKAAISNCSLYINAQNVFTITDYKVGDPEQNGAIYTIPMQRTFVGGINLNF